MPRSLGSIPIASQSWATAVAVAWRRVSRSWPEIAATPLARQLLVYPMLDDRNIDARPRARPFASWTYESNRIGWSALLGDSIGGDDVSSYAAPAREQNLARLAPAYVEVGELDIFRDEDIDYARRLAAAGVSVELHVHPGVPHGFDRIAPDSGSAGARWQIASVCSAAL